MPDELSQSPFNGRPSLTKIVKYTNAWGGESQSPINGRPGLTTESDGGTNPYTRVTKPYQRAPRPDGKRRKLGAIPLKVTKPYQRAPRPDVAWYAYATREVASQSPINGHLVLTVCSTAVTNQGDGSQSPINGHLVLTFPQMAAGTLHGLVTKPYQRAPRPDLL